MRVVAASGVVSPQGTVTFRVPDRAHRLDAVRLRPDLRIEANLDFHRAGDGWVLVIGRPPVARMEYLLEFRRPDGGDTGTDPGNPLLAAGAFGPKSVVEFACYTPPSWLEAPADGGKCRDLEVLARALDAAVAVRTWSPADAPDDEPLPLLVVHDGPEYDALASLTQYLAAGYAGGWLPRLRAALLSPGPRDRWYSANPSYARTLRVAVMPTLTGQLASTIRVGMGTSLGGLAMLHGYCRYPDCFDALFLQSGSFFCPAFDDQERGFPHYRRIVKFVADVHKGDLPRRPVPVVLTCGAVEENAENNRLMARTLGAHGYPATLHEVADAHNYTAWRDAFDPYLTGLLSQVSR